MKKLAYKTKGIFELSVSDIDIVQAALNTCTTVRIGPKLRKIKCRKTKGIKIRRVLPENRYKHHYRSYRKITNNGIYQGKENQLKNKYGITGCEYRNMLSRQGNNCAICNLPFPVNDMSYKGIHVDHCHTTGKVRGLLCSGCNTGIGQLKENVEIMKNAIKYIEKNSLK